MKMIVCIMIGSLIMVTICILYSALVVASNQDDADEEAERKRHAERFWEKGDE